MINRFRQEVKEDDLTVSGYMRMDACHTCKGPNQDIKRILNEED